MNLETARITTRWRKDHWDDFVKLAEKTSRAETLRLCRSRDAMLRGIAAGTVAQILARIQSQPRRAN